METHRYKDLDENELIKLCGEKKHEEAWYEFLNRYSEHIWKFARYNSRTIESNEFYLYVFQKLEDGKRLAKFDPSKAKFITWFNRVLKNLLVDLARKRSRESVEFVSIEKLPEPPTLRDPAKIHELEEKVRIAKWPFEDLPPEYRITWKLRNLVELELDTEDISWIARVSGQSVREVLDKIESIKGKLDKQREKGRIKDEKMQRVFNKILKLEKEVEKLRKETGAFDLDEEWVVRKLRIRYQEIQQRLRKLYKQRDNLLGSKKKDKFTVKVLTKDIASILNCKMNTVSTRLSRTDKIIENKFAKEKG